MAQHKDQLVAEAQEMKIELEADDDGGLLALLPRGSAGSDTRAVTNKPAATAKPKAKGGRGRPGQGSCSIPLAASRFRNKTARDYTDTTSLLQKAHGTATRLLEEESSDGGLVDAPLVMLKKRLHLLDLALAPRVDKPSADQQNADLHAAAEQDPYLADLKINILRQESCWTLGVLAYTRNVVLDLQPSMEALTVTDCLRYCHVCSCMGLCEIATAKHQVRVGV